MKAVVQRGNPFGELANTQTTGADELYSRQWNIRRIIYDIYCALICLNGS